MASRHGHGRVKHVGIKPATLGALPARVTLGQASPVSLQSKGTSLGGSCDRSCAQGWHQHAWTGVAQDVGSHSKQVTMSELKPGSPDGGQACTPGVPQLLHHSRKDLQL